MKDNELYADGSAIEATGFTYEHPNVCIYIIWHVYVANDAA